jgi:DNA-binding IclR family transcriptional regulator
MPAASSLIPDNILRFLQLRCEPASTSDIAKGLQLKKSDTRPLHKMLATLKERRAIEELPGGRYRLAGRNLSANNRQPPAATNSKAA